MTDRFTWCSCDSDISYVVTWYVTLLPRSHDHDIAITLPRPDLGYKYCHMILLLKSHDLPSHSVIT